MLVHNVECYLKRLWFADSCNGNTKQNHLTYTLLENPPKLKFCTDNKQLQKEMKHHGDGIEHLVQKNCGIFNLQCHNLWLHKI
jgi:hypothetical protein